MFTGIIEALGKIGAVDKTNDALSLRIECAALDMAHVQLGDSIAVNGVCLTVTDFSSKHFCADVSLESLRYTRFADMKVGEAVNLEKALTLSKPLGGHLVSGHVDGIGTITSVSREGKSLRYTLACPADMLKYIANKGSVTVDGVSLTVTGLETNGFHLNIVPHTSEHTIIPSYDVGTRVHLEVDLMARYAERLMQARDDHKKASGIDRSFLAKHGYKAN